MTQSMYQDYFGIRENPFSIIPDPHYLFMSQRHQEALAHLLYGISESGGFVLLTGEVGTGKTTICRTLMEQLPDDTDVAMILNPKLTEVELMAAICDEMRIPYPLGTKSLKDYFDFMNHHLLRAHAGGRNPVLLIDEAQNLSPNVMELIRLLTNLETAEKKLLQIILVGQPELVHMLAEPGMRQTAQRITARYHLQPLGLVETRAYIEHRLKVAGLDGRIFANRAVKSVFRASRGVPRLINSICDRALLAAYVEGKRQIDGKLAQRAAEEVLGVTGQAKPMQVWGSLLLVLVLTAALLLMAIDPYGWNLTDRVRQLTQPQTPPTVEAPVEKDQPGEVETVSTTEPAPQPASPPEPGPELQPETEPLPEPAPLPDSEIRPEPEPLPETAPNPAPIPAEATPEAPSPQAASPDIPATDATPTEDARVEDASRPKVRDAEPIDISKAEDALIGDLIRAGTADRAFVQLFGLWEQDYLKLDGATPCDKAKTANLNCAQGETDVDGLKAMNRPAVVSFIMPDQERLYGVVSAIEKDLVGDNVTIDFGDRAVSMRTQAFALRWPGDYLVLWKQPDIITRPLLFGQQGQDVVELRRLLAKVGYPDGEKDLIGEGSVFFGPSLREKLRLFQQDFGLEPTGSVDADTLLRLSGVANETFTMRINLNGG